MKTTPAEATANMTTRTASRSAAKTTTKTAAATRPAVGTKTAQPQKPLTLCIDIGGTGLKMMVIDAAGKPATERLRELTPENPTPKNVLAVLDRMRENIAEFDRVSVGFPGVIKGGHTMGAFNLDPAWAGFALQQTLQKTWKKPVRVANDAAIQGFAAIRRKGVELCLTLGTGLGSSLFVDGHLCPGLELAHHPWRKHKTYEDYLGKRGLERLGNKRWNHKVAQALKQIEALFNWDSLYIGGGNAKHLTIDLPKNVRITSNEDGLLGGVALWRDDA